MRDQRYLGHPDRSRISAATRPIQNLDNMVRRRYTTIAEAAEYLQISDQAVRRLIAGGELTGYRMGRSRRVIRVGPTKMISS